MPDTPAVSTDTESTGPPSANGDPAAACLISVAQLVTHPGNVREDLALTAEFCASVASSGVRIPLLITTDGDDGSFRVIEGHRRLAAAVRANLTEVPCVLDSARAGDEAGQLLDMAIANSDSYRRNFTPAEEAAALFAAHEAGATRTRIRRATGRKADEIKTALQAGGISADTSSRSISSLCSPSLTPTRKRSLPSSRHCAAGTPSNTWPSGSGRTVPKPPSMTECAPNSKPPAPRSLTTCPTELSGSTA
jgi:hypothetical protein